MPVAIGCGGSGVLGGKLYVFGICGPDGTTQGGLYAYDHPVTNTWSGRIGPREELKTSSTHPQKALLALSSA
jgi:hypothetical protein